jgi:hypothetical protein
MSTVQEQVTATCNNRSELSKPVESPDPSIKIVNWNTKWVFINVLDTKQELFVMEDMKFTLTKSTTGQIGGVLSYYITSKNWRTKTTELLSLKIVVEDSKGTGFTNWSIDNISVECGQQRQYREHETNFNLLTFGSISRARRDIYNTVVYKC